MLDDLSPQEKRQHLGGDEFPEELIKLLTGEPAHVRDRVLTLMPDLREKVQEVLVRRLNLDGKGFRTLQEAADELGKTKEIVRQQQSLGLRQLQVLLKRGATPQKSVAERRADALGKNFPRTLIELLSNEPSEMRERVIVLLPQLTEKTEEVMICMLNLDGKGFRDVHETAHELGKHVSSINALKNKGFWMLERLLGLDKKSDPPSP